MSRSRVPLSSRSVLRLRRLCCAAAIVLVLLPFVVMLLIGLFEFDPMHGVVAVAQALGAGGDGVFARAVASVARWLAEWWFVLMLLSALAGTLLMAGVALTERRLAVPLRIGWSLLFLGLFIALSPYLAAAAMLVFAWLFLRRPPTCPTPPADQAAVPAAGTDPQDD